MHSYEPQRSRRHYEDRLRALAAHIQNLRHSAQIFRRLQTAASDTAIYAWVLDRDATLARERMALAACAGLETFRLAQLDAGQTTVSLPGFGDVPVLDDIGPVDADAGVWLNTWLSGQLANDSNILDALAEQQLDVLRRPTPDALEYMCVLIEVLHTFIVNGVIDPDKITQAMIASDPAKLPRSGLPEADRIPTNDAIDHALYVATPIIELMHHLGRGDAEAFGQSARKHLHNHVRYWSQPGRAQAPEAMIAWPILATLAAARRSGLDVCIDDEYLPIELLDPQA